ncbi:hypothetical protein PSTG_11312 [Puccinia striiformis f. sp. tritici PST-78]|uniref:Uncharacterized protein n=1 Tax=Puccinia striiformis f. sp. tritici PST-78 TaxID=1165861 RepID=A0A0L0V8F2_9BASI|nr:hypothetical protein PSTG_11312 [Puccinia striiformis f. sp. tritici PST-78]
MATGRRRHAARQGEGSNQRSKAATSLRAVWWRQHLAEHGGSSSIWRSTVAAAASGRARCGKPYQNLFSRYSAYSRASTRHQAVQDQPSRGPDDEIKNQHSFVSMHAPPLGHASFTLMRPPWDLVTYPEPGNPNPIHSVKRKRESKSAAERDTTTSSKPRQSSPQSLLERISENTIDHESQQEDPDSTIRNQPEGDKDTENGRGEQSRLV